MTYTTDTYTLQFQSESFQHRLVRLKNQFIDSQGKIRNFLNATIFFEKDTLIEFPSRGNYWRKEITHKIRVQLIQSKDGFIHYAKPNRKRMNAITAFPLDKVTKIVFDFVDKKKTPQPSLKKLLNSRSEGVWTDLSEESLKSCIQKFKTLSMDKCLYSEDYEQFKRALELKQPFEASRIIQYKLYRTTIEIDECGDCRVWLFIEDESDEIEKTYLVLNEKIAIHYPLLDY